METDRLLAQSSDSPTLAVSPQARQHGLRDAAESSSDQPTVRDGIEADSTRVLCLEPGQPGDPLIGYFDVVRLRPYVSELNPPAEDCTEAKDKAAERESGAPSSAHPDQNEFEDAELQDSDGSPGHPWRNGPRKPHHYEAISYAWGSRTLSHTLRIPGRGTVAITEALHGALQHFRNSLDMRRLWADAVCIDQANPQEKSQQVRSMSRIFNCADRVLVWLGEGQPSDGLAFTTITVLKDQRFDDILDASGLDTALDWLGEELFRYPTCLSRFCCTEEFELGEDPAAAGILAAGRLFARSWFERLWVVQEVTYRLRNYSQRNQVIACSGSHFTSLADFMHLSSVVQLVLESASERLSAPLNAGEDLNQVLSGHVQMRLFLILNLGQAKPQPMELIEFLSRRKCSDPRDRLFSVMGVLTLTRDTGNPDYTIATAEVHRRLALALMQEHTPWTVLALVGTEAHNTTYDGRPTWVPYFHDFTEQSRKMIDFLGEHNRDALPLYGTDLTSFQDGIHVNGQGQLQVRGRRFADVQHILASRHHLDHVRKFNLTGQHARTQDQVLDHHWYSALANLLSRGHCEHDRMDGLETVCSSVPLPRPQRSDAPHDLTRARWEHLAECIHDAWDLDQSWVLSSVVRNDGEGDLCWVPKDARPGDGVAVFRGAPYPFVLRRHVEEGFEVVGMAFTAATTLWQALGGARWPRSPRTTFPVDPWKDSERWYMDWNSPDEEMQRLIDQLELILLV